MHKFLTLLCLLSLSLLCSFRPAPFFDRPQNPYLVKNIEKSLPKLARKEYREAWIHTLKNYIRAQDWHLLGLMVRAAMDDCINVSELENLASEMNCQPFSRAILATKNIRTLAPKLSVSKGELFRMALFLETELEDAVSTTGNYLSRKKTGFACTIEFDPETKNSFIHLAKDTKNHLGSGVQKQVSRSILYNADKPEMIACCTSANAMRGEIEALKKMQNASGVVKLHAVTERANKDNTKTYALMCELYDGGSLSQALQKKTQFTLKQKLDIARNLLTGLEAIHQQKLVHRDLTTRNVLLSYQKAGKKKVRQVKAVWCDFGRATFLHDALAVKTQANMAYMPPEGIIFEKLESEAYYKSDLYALGCVFQQLLTGKRGPWIDKVNLKNPTQPGYVREAKFVYDITKHRKKRLAKLAKIKSRKAAVIAKSRFEKMILTMIDAKPERRGTVEEHKKDLEEIISQLTTRQISVKIQDLSAI